MTIFAPARRGASRLSPFTPRLTELPDRTMAVVRTVGDPGVVGQAAFPALFGAVYGLKFALRKQGIAFTVEPPLARWFGGEEYRDIPRDEWEAAWAIPIPDGTESLPQKNPALPVVIETWTYGPVAEVLHIGAYADEEPTIRLLHEFIAANGLEIAGAHEEVYLSRPGVANQKTLIRYQVRPRG